MPHNRGQAQLMELFHPKQELSTVLLPGLFVQILLSGMEIAELLFHTILVKWRLVWQVPISVQKQTFFIYRTIDIFSAHLELNI